MVRTGKSYDGRVEVLSGLAGDEVLVTGDVHDGSPIQPR
jgi:multidrug efflux pump subunit AcrA (membrane-fusion protein)